MTKAEELRRLRVSRQIPAKDMVAVVQELYPRFDKPTLSRCEHGGECGVSIPDDALDLLYDRFAPDLKQHIQDRRKDRHRLTCKVSARLDATVFETLQRRIEADGYATVQSWLTDMVMAYIE